MVRRVLVTGAAGFIGSHVAQALLERQYTVVGLDNLNHYYDSSRKEANISEVIGQTAIGADFQFFRGDIRDHALLDELFTEFSFDAVVHLAAMAGVRNSIADPHLYYDVNLTGTLNLLNAARDNEVQNFVFASTSSVYGNTEQIPFKEKNTCDRPLAPYPASKRAAEMLGHSYYHLYGQNFTALRFFTVYGPRGRPDMMAYKVLDNIFFGREVPIYNNGQMYRDWTYIDDIVSGIVTAVDQPLGYEVINLGRGESILLADFVKLIEQLAGQKANLIPEPMPDADIQRTYADISKARRLLDYAPQVSVEEGVTRFWHWYRDEVLEPA